MKRSAARNRYVLVPAALLGTVLAPTGAMGTRATSRPAGPAVLRSPEELRAERASEITPEQQDAVRLGLRWLAGRQRSDGAFASGQFRRHVGITGLACLAFMSDGSVPGRGKYGEVVEKGLGFVLSCSDSASGFLAADVSHGPMYGHGFATLFLAEVYGMTESPEIQEKLRKAVRLIVDCQNRHGGWRYNPVPSEADVSVTICQVMALRAARNAGIDVPKSTIDKAIRYVKKAQHPDGGFRYRLGQGPSMFPRSAAGVATLFYAGIYEGPEIERGLEYLMDHLPTRTKSWHGRFYHYGHYYAVQAMFLAGGEYWEQWWPAVRDEILSKQVADGSWSNTWGQEYGTAMSLIILQMPNRLLPIFQR